MPGAQLLLRIFADNSTTKVCLGKKYGDSLDSTGDFLLLAKQTALNVIGISFHVGSGASKVQVYAEVVRDARVVFDQAIAFVSRRSDSLVKQAEDKAMLYVNDGMYGNFENTLIEPPILQPRQVQLIDNSMAQSDGGRRQDTHDSESIIVRSYMIWGRTCDGCGLILDECGIPGNIQCNDWLWFPKFGGGDARSSTFRRVLSRPWLTLCTQRIR